MQALNALPLEEPLEEPLLLPLLLAPLLLLEDELGFEPHPATSRAVTPTTAAILVA
jgi:hypothetical protein